MTVQSIEFAKDVETGKPVKTTIKDIIANRMLWEGDSGSGKSHGMTGVIEQTDGKAQRIIIDPEGEYFTLKNKFQFLLIGQKTEQVTPNVVLNTDDIYVDKLVKKLIQFSNDSIIDLSENASEATHFLNIFQKAVFKYAKLMKRPLLIFVDEAHIFAPEKGQGNEESLKAMKELAKRGRKRGIGLICGTQAIADFSKDVVRQLRLRFIGNCTYDNDVKAAAHFLGFGKEREPELRELGEEHHFFVAGKGITIGGKKPKHVVKIQCNANETKLFDFDFDKNFKLNEKDTAAMKKFAENFSDIPQLIDEELNEKERLQKDNFEIKKQLQDQKVKIIQLERQQPKQDPKAIEKAYSDGYGKAIKHAELQYGDVIKKYQIYIRQSKVWIEAILTQTTKLKALSDNETIDVPKLKFREPTIPKYVSPSITPPIDPTKPAQVLKPVHLAQVEGEEYGDTKLNGPQTKVLTAILQCPDHRGTKKRIALYCGYAVNGGAFGNIKGSLKSNGFITYEGDILAATEKGIAAIPNYDPLPTDPQEILNFWTNKLGDAKGKVLAAIFNKSPISRDELAEQTGYAVGGGAFGNILGNLRTLGLINYLPDKQIGISPEIMPGVYA